MAGSSREQHPARRVRPKLDFLESQEDFSEGFHNLRSPSQLSHKSVRRVRAKEHSDIFDKKGITDTIVRMFTDDFQDLLNFFSDTLTISVTQEDEIISNPFCSLFPTTELAQCYAQSHKCPPIQESREEKEKL